MPLATQSVLFEDGIYYPDTDEQPMAENDFQFYCMVDLISQFKIFFQEQSEVYVSGDLLIYYEKGNPKARVAPDVFVVFGVPKQKRRIYQTWVEGKTPDVVFEIAPSPTAYQTDEQFKPELYQRLGIQEYFQYDPTGECMQPALRGRRLDDNGQYQEINANKLLPRSAFSLLSQQLGLELHLSQGELKVFNPNTESYLLTHSEEMAARRLAEKQVKYERKQKEWAQQHTKLVLEVEQERQQKELALKQAEQERQEKELAQQQANQLAEQLRALGINPDEILKNTSIIP